MKLVTMTFAFMLLACLGAAPTQAQDQSVVAWGWNQHGQCNAPSPNAGFVAVAGGDMHSLGVGIDGTIVAWGDNSWGQADVPQPNIGFIACAAGWRQSLGLKSDGTIAAWGADNWGQCDVPTPNTGFVAIASGWVHSLGLKSDGTIVAWGWNDYGQCDVPEPNAGFVAIAAGYGHSLGLKSDGTIVAWGYDFSGQCSVPAPNAGFTAIAAGGAHSLGLKSDGTIVAWGHNGFGECDVPSPNAGFVAIAGGFDHSLGLKAGGMLVAWGLNEYGQCTVPGPNAGFVGVAAGSSHSLALQVPVAGACCHDDGACIYLIQADCVAPGVWQGAGTTCTPNPCESTPVLVESWAASSLAEGLQIRWEVPLGTTGALYRIWRDPVAGPRDSVPTPDAVVVSSGWISASAEGIIEAVDPGAPRGTPVRYFLETSANGGEFIGPVDARWDPPAPVWSAGPTPFRGTVRLSPPGPGPARAEIFNPAGQLVRTLMRTGGDAQLEWDGRDDAGRKVSAGVYVVAFSTPAGETSGRVVLTK